MILLLSVFSTELRAQRIIKGTIFWEGEPAAGAIVEAHRGETIRTGFEGKYEVEAWNNSKWVKFTYKNESVKVNISDITSDVFDFAFNGEVPSDESNSEISDLVLKTHDELIKDKNQEYLNEYSLYQEFYKLNYFELALPHWKNIFTKYPKSSPNITSVRLKIP
jgi:hypothetical protein